MAKEYLEIVIRDKETSHTNIKIECLFQAFSNLSNMFFLGASQNEKVLTCEPNLIKLNEQYKLIKAELNYLNKYIGLEMSDENSLINDYVKFSFINPYSVREKPLILEIEFDEVVVNFQIKFTNTQDEIKTYQYENNSSKNIKIEYLDSSNLFPIKNIIVSFEKTKEPYRFIKINKMVLNQLDYFNKDKILEHNIIEEEDLLTNNFVENSANFTILNNKYDLIDIKEYAKKLKNNVAYFVRVNHKNNEKIVKNIGFFDIIEILLNNEQNINFDTKFFYDLKEEFIIENILSNESAYDVIKLILGENNVSFLNESYFKNFKISGLIPKTTKKEALKYVLELCNGTILKNNKDLTINSKYKIIHLDSLNSNNYIKRKNIKNEGINFNQYNVETRIYKYYEYNSKEMEATKHQINEKFRLTDVEYTDRYHIDFDIDFDKPQYVDSYSLGGVALYDYQNNLIEVDGLQLEIIEKKLFNCKIRLYWNYMANQDQYYLIKLQSSIESIEIEYDAKEYQEYGSNSDYNIITINNPLFSLSYDENLDIDKISNYYLKYSNYSNLNLDILKNNNYEVGNCLYYVSKNKYERKLIISKIEYDDSIIQKITGVLIDE